jgi:uncharacterized protein (TIGR02646 family)
MRPVDKGAVDIAYADYGQARHELAQRLGYYCSYCEMKVFNSIAVEHVLPRNNHGAALEWGNLLLSCKYCNTVKSDHNLNLKDFFWPDRDNTDLAFEYSTSVPIRPHSNLSQDILIKKAIDTISLSGLNRFPGGDALPTKADTRWRSREEAWAMAQVQYRNWLEAPIIQMAKSIANAAGLGGHYSIWREVFKGVDLVLHEIDCVYFEKGLFKAYQLNRARAIRQNGLL